jgi:hypothetical protein
MTEEEEFEFRNRLEREQGAARPPQSQGNYFTEGLKNVALGGLRGGPMGVITAGAGEAMKGLEKVGEVGGDFTTDQMAKIAPPEAAAAAGTAVKLAPSLLVGGTGGAQAGKAALESGAKTLMGQALRAPAKAEASGDAARAIDTMLNEGISATKGGAVALRQKITALKAEVGKLISDNPGTLVDKAHVYRELASTLDDVSKLARPDAAMDAVRKAWDGFKNHPLARDVFRGEYGPGEQIPLRVADEIKRTTQKSVKDAYGRQTATPIDDQIDMAMATGLRKGAEAEIPEIGTKNAKISEYLNALHLIEPRAAQFAKQHIGGIAPLAESAEATMVMLADRNPWLKSYIARVLHEGQQTIPGAAGAATGATINERGRR